MPTTIAAFAYLAMPLLLGSGPRPVPHFQQLADAFLHGRLTIRIPPVEAARPHVVDELIPAAQPDRYYCAYPPLPAFVLLPVVAIAGPAASVATAGQVISILNVWLFAVCLWRLPRRLEQPDSSPASRTAIILLFALGTVCWHNAEMGGDWHLAHAVALTAMLLALRESLDRGRLTLIGGFVALAVLARPPAALTAVFFVLPAIRQRRVPDIVKLAAFPALAALLLASYNHARFGSPTDFGYDRMILHGVGRQLMEQFGQFHPHFVLRNAFWFFLAPPWATPAGQFPYLGFDPRGLSLFASSPALLYAVVALWRRSRGPLVRDALLGTIA